MHQGTAPLNVRERTELEEIEFVVRDAEQAVANVAERAEQLKKDITDFVMAIMEARVAMEDLAKCFPVHAVIRIQAGPSGV